MGTGLEYIEVRCLLARSLLWGHHLRRGQRGCGNVYLKREWNITFVGSPASSPSVPLIEGAEGKHPTKPSWARVQTWMGRLWQMILSLKCGNL